MTAPVQLRDYQSADIGRIRASMRRHRRVLYQAPTGSGKTVLFAWLARSVAARGKRVCILNHRRELLRQTGDKLADFGVPYVTIAAGTRTVQRAPVSIASVQTLARRLELYRDAFDFLIVDEAHHAVAGSWRAITEAYRDAYQLGVTATPSRLDGRGLGDCYDDLVIGPPVRELIDQGYLSDYVAYWPPEGGPDLSGIRTRMGDFDTSQLASVMERQKLVGDAVEHYRRHADGLPAVAFCVTAAHAEQVAAAFRDAGYRAESVDGRLDQVERDRRIRGLATGEVQVLTSCELISEGLDIPAISAAILLRPTKSLGLCLQQCGRALRPKPNGGRAVILDHAGNLRTHGLPCFERSWSLTAARRSKRAAAAPVRQCLECYAVVPAGVRACPQCGEEFPAAAGEPPETLAGELVEADSRFWGPDGRPTVERNQASIEAALAKCASWEDLELLRKALGFKPGWSRAVARNRGWKPIALRTGFIFKYVPVGERRAA